MIIIIIYYSFFVGLHYFVRSWWILFNESIFKIFHNIIWLPRVNFHRSLFYSLRYFILFEYKYKCKYSLERIVDLGFSMKISMKIFFFLPSPVNGEKITGRRTLLKLKLISSGSIVRQTAWQRKPREDIKFREYLIKLFMGYSNAQPCKVYIRINRISLDQCSREMAEVERRK